eukprot:gene19612-22304_t
MFTTQSLAGGESETLQSFVLRRLTEDEPRIRNKIYDLVMEFHSVQSTSKSSLLETGDRRVSFVENDNVDLIQESAVSTRIRASGLVAKSGFHSLPDGAFLPPGWKTDPNSISLAYNFESVSLQFLCESRSGEVLVSARKLCDDFCGPILYTELSVNRFVSRGNNSESFSLLHEQAEQDLHAEITALVLRIFPEMDETDIPTLPPTQHPTPISHKRKTCPHSSDNSMAMDATPLRLPPLPPMSASPLDAVSLSGSVCGSLHDASSLSSREKEDTLPDFAPLARSDGPRPKLPSFQEMFEGRSDGGPCKQMRHEVTPGTAGSGQAHRAPSFEAAPARVSSGSWAGMDYDYAMHGSNFYGYETLSDDGL